MRNSISENKTKTDLCEILGIKQEDLVQLVLPFTVAKATYPCAVQEKYDGCFCIAYRNMNSEDGFSHTKIYSRTGKQYLSMQHLEKCFNEMFNGTNKDFVIFEAYIPNTIQSEISGACRDTVNQHPEIIAVIHDWLTMGEYLGKVQTPYNTRLGELIVAYSNFHYPCMMLPKGRVCYNLQQIKDFAQEIFDRGGEGVVVKKLAGYYKHGKRVADLMKYKQTISYDLEVVDLQEGTGRYKNAVGSLICRFSGNRLISVGTGLTAQQRKLWWLNKDLAIGQIAEVQAMRLTASGLLREPRFKGFRTDKAVADY